MRLRLVAPLLMLAVCRLCLAVPGLEEPERYNYEEKPWVEEKTTLPEYPQDANLMEFTAGPTERNRFFVDGSSIVIGGDGVVRFVLVVKTAGGATNITFEAMHCATKESKLFAVGRADSTWEKLETPQWRPIENKLINHYRAALSRDFLCPAGSPPRDVASARSALKRGKHPDAP